MNHPRQIPPDIKEHADLVAEALVRRIDTDEEFRKRFWQAGFIALSTHASDAGSRWIGRKIAVLIATALLGWSVVYLVKTGAFK